MKRENRTICDPLIILDCDGVLIDSEFLAARVEVEELCRLGCSITTESYLDRVLGRTEDEHAWSEIAACCGVRLPDGFTQTMRTRVAEVFERELQPVAGVELALEQMRFPLCVASGSRPERLFRSLELTGLTRFFQGNIFSAASVPRGKPHPDLFLYVASRMEKDPRDCIVIEDSQAGVRAAVSAGMTVLGFTGARHCTPSHGAVLLRAGCRLVFDRIEELPDLCEEITRPPGP